MTRTRSASTEAPDTDPLVALVAHLTRYVASFQARAGREGGLADLSLRQIHYLDVLDELGTPTTSELARALGVSKPSVSVAVRRLEGAGYLRRAPSDEDGRSHHLHLTEKGRAFLGAHGAVHDDIARLLTRGLSRREADAMKRLAHKVVRSLEGRTGR
jgi:DNA-binding MarR family transcriptional regulator